MLNASNADLFEYNPASLNAEMQELNDLESFVSNNAGVTYTDMLMGGNSLLVNIENPLSPISNMSIAEGPLGIPSILWGCCLGLIGVLIVYIVSNEDKHELKMSLVGCLIGTAVSIVYYSRGGY